MSEDLNKRAAMTDEVKAAVELSEAIVWLHRKISDGPYSARMVEVIASALSRLTEENERLNAIIAQGMVNEVSAKLSLTKAEAEGDEALEALSTLLERCRAHGGLSRQGYAERKAMDDATALLARSAQKEGA